ncbi:hypothetical protein BVY03_02655 [bacterium K02(2017)]|nr:hypothetical protein BVY03_02655 [bacterium K02(2017)]
MASISLGRDRFVLGELNTSTLNFNEKLYTKDELYKKCQKLDDKSVIAGYRLNFLDELPMTCLHQDPIEASSWLNAIQSKSYFIKLLQEVRLEYGIPPDIG